MFLRMRSRMASLLLVLVLCPALFSQAPSSNQPLQVKEGLWDLTFTKHAVANISDDVLKQLPPDQKERVLAAVKAGQSNALSHKMPFCLTRENLASGNIFANEADCTKQRFVSTGQKLDATLQCEDAQHIISIERVSATSFTGSETTIQQDTPGGKMDSTFSATWTSADCGDVTQASEQAEPVPLMGAGVAAQQPSGEGGAPPQAGDSTTGAQSAEPAEAKPQGPDRDVLSFLPNPPKQGYLGSYLAYFWMGSTYPDFAYRGNAPGIPKRRGTPHVDFNGTDGTYLYLTLRSNGDSICIPTATLLRVDRAGQITVVDRAPEGLHGGLRLPYYCESNK